MEGFSEALRPQLDLRGAARLIFASLCAPTSLGQGRERFLQADSKFWWQSSAEGRRLHTLGAHIGSGVGGEPNENVPDACERERARERGLRKARVRQVFSLDIQRVRARRRAARDRPRRATVPQSPGGCDGVACRRGRPARGRSRK